MYFRMICVLCSIRYLEVDDRANHIFLYAYLSWAELSRGKGTWTVFTNSSEYLTLNNTLVRTINQTPIITSPLEFQISKNSNYTVLAYYHSAHSKCQSS